MNAFGEANYYNYYYLTEQKPFFYQPNRRAKDHGPLVQTINWPKCICIKRGPTLSLSHVCVSVWLSFVKTDSYDQHHHHWNANIEFYRVYIYTYTRSNPRPFNEYKTKSETDCCAVAAAAVCALVHCNTTFPVKRYAVNYFVLSSLRIHTYV